MYTQYALRKDAIYSKTLKEVHVNRQKIPPSSTRED